MICSLPELGQAAQDARERCTVAVRTTLPRAATVYSLSGLGICGQCGSTLHIQPARRALVRRYAPSPSRHTPLRCKSVMDSGFEPYASQKNPT